MNDVIVIGAGAVGAFVARSLSRYDVSVLVIEKESDVGDASSMANSAIVHSGYDPEPGSFKARFNVAGNRMFPQLCRELDVPMEQIGSLTIAIFDDQIPLLERLLARSKQNGVEARLLSAEEVKKMEPNINPEVKGALYCPSAGIVSPFELVAHAFENALDNGVKLHLEETVTKIEKISGGFLVATDKGTYQSKVVINCAGVHSDDISRMIEPVEWSITPRKGEYFVLDHYAKGLVNHVLFPLPSDKGKGILVTTTYSGNYLLGPTSEIVGDKDDVSTDPLTLAKVKEGAALLVPRIPFGEQIRVFSGLRATSSTHDFIIGPSATAPSFINVAGIESPGLVSSPAIGEYVATELVGKIIPLKTKTSYKASIKSYLKPLDLPLEERNALIKKDPRYGVLVCNCERVSLGEIEDILSRSLPCLSVKALKKRSRAGFGKCQGGFCQPQVVKILAEHFGVSPLEVLYDKVGSGIVLAQTKEKVK
jgi:glycerol-3-phosphate dehydrogenase